ncbi:hypothetical protein ACFWVM_19000 [Nocardia fluminea]|uniref:hypothetical protein n=1 Tax=Nocardia fluminea TaxID=134984 RepID=UPI00366116B7
MKTINRVVAGTLLAMTVAMGSAGVGHADSVRTLDEGFSLNCTPIGMEYSSDGSSWYVEDCGMGPERRLAG